jgi:uncharacterized protein (DUF58 family)
VSRPERERLRAELARLNHVLVPATRAERDRYRRGLVARRLRSLSWLFSRLSREGRALCSIASLTLIVGADLGRSQSHVLPLATLSVIVAALIMSRAYRSTGVSVQLRVPQRVALGDELCITLDLANAGPRDLQRLRTEPPLLPWDGRFTELPADIDALPGGGRERTYARARFTARGAHHLDPFRVAALVPLGLAQGPAQESPGASFMVVPRVARVTTLGAAARRRHQPGGVAGASRNGDASDLVGVRPYRPGDALRDLHARSWARHGTPMVRQYQEEYFTRVGIVVDTDATVKTPAHLEAALSLAAGVIARLCSGEALVDVLVTGGRTERLSLGRHTASLERALDALGAVQATRGFESDALLAQLAPHLDRLSSVVFVALAWDAPRAALVAAIEAKAVTTSVLVVDDGAERTPRLTRVSVAAIGSGEELAL